MVLELRGFFLKRVLGDKKLLFCNMENIIDTTNRKENLFNPIEKAMKSKVPLFKKRKTFEVGLVVGNGPLFQFTCIKTVHNWSSGPRNDHVLNLGSCVHLQSLRFKV